MVEQFVHQFIQFYHRFHECVALCWWNRSFFFAIYGRLLDFLFKCCIILYCDCFFHVAKYSMNIMPRASVQNTRQDHSSRFLRLWCSFEWLSLGSIYLGDWLSMEKSTWWWIHVSFIVKNRCKAHLDYAEMPPSCALNHCCFWSFVCKRGTPSPQGFFICKSLWKIFHTHSVGIFIISAISPTFTLWSSKQYSGYFLVFSRVDASILHPKH